MKYMKTEKRIQRELTQLLCALLLMAVGSMTGYAQSDCFTYENGSNETIIDGLTPKGQAATSLTIPATVTTVESGAFYYAGDNLSTLVIEAGGNPTFKSGLFDTKSNPLCGINILGSSMTVANIRALLVSLVARGALETVYIEGYSDAWIDIVEKEEPTAEESTLLAVLATKVKDDSSVSYVSVALPAALVTTQQFGDAKVYGHFEITKELITFCGNATFRDTDNGSNMLFYLADGIADDGRLHIQRVDFVVAGEGVLIHRTQNSQGSCDLERYDGDVSYNKNMLVGVTTDTQIYANDGNYTNYVLYDAAFHPTSGGTLSANKAYLQVPTDPEGSAKERLSIVFDDEETTEISTTNFTNFTNSDTWYDLQGRKVAQPTRGIYINNGKKYIIQ